MSKIRIGLIGYGKWTRAAFLPALENDGRAEIVSVAAPSQNSRDRAQNDFGASVAVFDGFESLLKGPALDAVMIAVPDPMHEAALTAVLDSGAAVMFEPPVADKRDRLPAMLKRLVDASQITHADLELGLIPAVGRTAELVQAGVIGRIQSLGIRVESSWGPKPGFDLCNPNHMSPWYLDVLNRIMGAHPERVFVFDGTGVSGRRQNHNISHYDYAGARGTVQANIGCVGALSLGVEVNGDNGDIAANLLTGEVRVRTREKPEWESEYHPAIQPYADLPGMYESITVFLDAVESGEQSFACGIELAKLRMAGLAAEESKDSGAWAEIQDVKTIFG